MGHRRTRKRKTRAGNATPSIVQALDELAELDQLRTGGDIAPLGQNDWFQSDGPQMWGLIADEAESKEMSTAPLHSRRTGPREGHVGPGGPIYRDVQNRLDTGSQTSAGPARTSSSPSPGRHADSEVPSLPFEPVCPFCGLLHENAGGTCPRCNMEDTPVTREATQAKLGGWFVYQARNPAAPGMNFVTLLGLIERGRVNRKSILRGPTTAQFWRYATRVKGISREFGLCWNCGGEIRSTARVCPKCKHLQEPPINPDALLEGEPLASPAPNPEPMRSGRAGSSLGLLNLTELAGSHHDTQVPAPAAASTDARPTEQPPAGLLGGGAPADPGTLRDYSILPRAARSNGRPAPEEMDLVCRASTLQVIDMGDMDDQTLASGRELAAFNLPANYAVGARPRRILKGVMLASFLTVFSVAALVYVNPPLARKYAAIGNQLAATLSKAAKLHATPPVAMPAAYLQRNGEVVTPPASTTSASAQNPGPTAASPPPAVAMPAAPSAKPPPFSDITLGPADSAASQLSSHSRDSVPDAHVGIPVASLGNSDIQVSPPPVAPPDLATARDQEQDLWRSAIAAEGRGDNNEAIRLFESIKQLPDSVWPMSLDMRLQRAQAQLHKTTLAGDGQKY